MNPNSNTQKAIEELEWIVKKGAFVADCQNAAERAIKLLQAQKENKKIQMRLDSNKIIDELFEASGSDLRTHSKMEAKRLMSFIILKYISSPSPAKQVPSDEEIEDMAVDIANNWAQINPTIRRAIEEKLKLMRERMSAPTKQTPIDEKHRQWLIQDIVNFTLAYSKKYGHPLTNDERFKLINEAQKSIGIEMR